MIAVMGDSFNRQHLTGTRDLRPHDIRSILDLAKQFKTQVQSKSEKPTPSLKDQLVVNFFFEPSTRTRASFEMAARQLGATVMNYQVASSSTTKGESLFDTIQTHNQWKPSFYIIRHSASGVPEFATRHTTAHVVNAGDGTHEHPTQALLDLMTIEEIKGTLAGLRVAIVGDILHSRVARSNIHAMKTMGMDVTLCGPQPLLPVYFKDMGVTTENDLQKAVADVDVIMLLRIQKERLGGHFFPSLHDYSLNYRLDEPHLKQAKPNVTILHPGPINRGIELTDAIADHSQTMLLKQVENGVFVRMAVLHLLNGGR